MFHTERDAAVFMAEMLLSLGALTTAIYAVAIVIALLRKAFRTRRALYISFVLSAIASIPFVCSLVLQWPYLPGEWDINPTVGRLSLLGAVPLGFVWLAPLVQYRFARKATSADMRADA